MNRFSQLFGEDLCQPAVCQRFRSGQVVCLSFMAGGRERFGSYGGYVPDIDQADRSVSSRREKHTFFRDQLAETQQCLHEEIRAEKGPVHPGITQCFFDPGVVTEKTNRRVSRRRQLRQLHDMLHARFLRRPDEGELMGFRLFRRMRQQKCFFDTFQCGVEA